MVGISQWEWSAYGLLIYVRCICVFVCCSVDSHLSIWSTFGPSSCLNWCAVILKLSNTHILNPISPQIKTFEQTMDNIPEQKTETLHLLLSACKLLDLMMVMQTEDFQM